MKTTTEIAFPITIPDKPTRLARRLNTFDAVVLGLGSMIGAGVFAAIGPAAAAAGTGLLLGLALAAIVAYANATSSAQLAAVYPEAGGTYVYGRELLSPFWGYLAGWGFVVGKTASLAAMALTFGAYAFPAYARPVGIGAVVGMTVVNYLGVRRTVNVTRVVVALVIAVLAVVVSASLLGGTASIENLLPVTGTGLRGIMESAGLLFFAFAGYARVATLGEEVKDPVRTIPRAIPLALGVALVIYAAVAISALLAVGPDALAEAEAPLAAAVSAGRYASFTPIVRFGATLAVLGVLGSLLAGVSRTGFAMARNGELPKWLGAVHPIHKVPHRAELAVGAIVSVVAAFVDLRGSVAFSSFAVLFYYAIANASAWRQPPRQRRWPKALQVFGAVGCALLAFSLPIGSVLLGGSVLAVGGAVWLIRSRGIPGEQSAGHK